MCEWFFPTFTHASLCLWISALPPIRTRTGTHTRLICSLVGICDQSSEVFPWLRSLLLLPHDTLKPSTGEQKSIQARRSSLKVTDLYGWHLKVCSNFDISWWVVVTGEFFFSLSSWSHIIHLGSVLHCFSVQLSQIISVWQPHSVSLWWV